MGMSFLLVFHVKRCVFAVNWMHVFLLLSTVSRETIIKNGALQPLLFS